MFISEKNNQVSNQGKLLFLKAKKADDLDQVNQELFLLREILRETPEISDFLSRERVGPGEKMKVLNELLKHFSPLVAEFITTVYELGEFLTISNGIAHFKFYYYDYQDILFAEITTVIELSQEQKRKLEIKLKEIFPYRQIKIWNLLDTNILGGIIIRTKSKQIDHSIRTQLERMSQNYFSELS